MNQAPANSVSSRRRPGGAAYDGDGMFVETKVSDHLPTRQASHPKPSLDTGPVSADGIPLSAIEQLEWVLRDLAVLLGTRSAFELSRVRPARTLSQWSAKVDPPVGLREN